LTEFAQSTGGETIGIERTLSTLLASGQVNRLSRITHEYNGKIRPQPNGEKLFKE